MMEFGDNRLKRMARFLYKWLWCSWIHRRKRCYPEVDKLDIKGPWHCRKCHKCGEIFDLYEGKKLGWL